MIAEVTLYTVLKFFHVLVAITWVGGAILLQMLAPSAIRSRLPGRVAEFSEETERVAKRVFLPSGVLMLLLGIALVEEGDWSFGDFWIVFGIVGLLASMVLGAGYLGPQTAKVKDMIQSEGAESPAVKSKIAGLNRVGRIDLVILVAIVFVMVTKMGS